MLLVCFKSEVNVAVKRMTKAQRELKMAEALDLSAAGLPYTKIAERLEVSWPTARKLVEDELAKRAEHRSHDREKSIAVKERVIREAWEGYENTHNRSLNRTGFLNTILRAQEGIDKLTGALAPLKHQDVTDSFEIVFDDEFAELED